MPRQQGAKPRQQRFGDAVVPQRGAAERAVRAIQNDLGAGECRDRDGFDLRQSGILVQPLDRAAQHRPPHGGIVGDTCVALADNPADAASRIDERGAKAAAAEIASQIETQSRFPR